MFLSKRKVNTYLRHGYDLNFISRIQPQGNVNFKENDAYWKQGDGYHQVLHIPHDKFPESGLPDNWLQELALVNGVNTFIAIEHASNEELSERTANAISNMLTTENRKATEDIDDQGRIQSLIKFRAQMGNNIPYKLISVTFFISGDSEKELRENARNLKSRLSQFHLSSNDGMQDVEFNSAFVPASRKMALPTRRRGQAVSVIDLGAGYPFNHTTLMDDHGVYVGQARTGGAVIFDLLQEDDMRGTPSLLIAGQDRTDKEKFLGKQLDALFAKGHQLYNIDLSGVLADLTATQGGIRVPMYGSENNGQNQLNIMQVIATQTLDNGEDDDQIESFRAQRKKLQAFAQIKDPSLSNSDLNNLNSAVSELYEDLGLWHVNAENLPQEELHVTDVVPEDYPVLGQLVEKLISLQDENDVANKGDKADSYGRLKDAFQSILDDYRFLDTHSNFEDFSRETITTFDLSGIQDEVLLNIQLYQVLSLIFSYAVNNGKRNTRIFKEGTNLSKDQMKHTVITITVAEKIFNPHNPKSLEFLANTIQNITKNYAAIILEVSNLDGILLTNSMQSADDYTIATRQVFGSLRYRLFARVQDNTVGLLANSFDGEFTPSELNGLKYLRQGQFFLNIAGVKNLLFNQQLSDYNDVDGWGMRYSEEERYQMLR